MSTKPVTHDYARTRVGELHYAECGNGHPLLCLHQTPRSWDEYRELLPLLGKHFRVIAMDTPGMGASAPPPDGPSIETYADAALALLEHLNIDRCAVIGHHTGGVIAFRLSAIATERVTRLVLSSTPFVNQEGRKLRETRPPIDEVEPDENGAHLVALWQKRQAFYPQNRPDLLHRFLCDAMKCVNPEDGHRAVARYQMERDLESVEQPTLIVGHDADPFAYPETKVLASVMPHAENVTVKEGMVPLEFKAEAFAKAVLPFLRRDSRQ